MASGFLAVLDDIALLMDDVAMAAKVATKKTAGILGDDLAVNAEKATGFLSSREIPVLWAITKGSFINKLIIVPVAIGLNIFWPVSIKVILVIGGLYLAYEGMEKIVEFLFHKKPVPKPAVEQITDDPAAEKAKIKSAVLTDFILSVEIVIIALGTAAQSSMTIQILSVSVVAILATVGVYGIVALIVRMDDLGFKLIKKSGEKGLLNAIGVFLVKALPILIKMLAVVGTIALLLVSGGIFSHNIGFLHGIFPTLPAMVTEFGLGIIVGIVAVLIMKFVTKVFGKKAA